jgi:hypothetical protein
LHHRLIARDVEIKSSLRSHGHTRTHAPIGDSYQRLEVVKPTAALQGKVAPTAAATAAQSVPTHVAVAVCVPDARVDDEKAPCASASIVITAS